MSIWTKDFMAWAKPKPAPNLGDYGSSKPLMRVGCLLTACITVPILILLVIAMLL